MSGPQASRNPFMPPPNTLTVSASAWSRQNITFNVLFNIMDQGREVTEDQAPSFQELSTTTANLWPISETESIDWSNYSPSEQMNSSSSPASSPVDQDNTQIMQGFNDVDQILDSIGQVLSGFDSLDPQFHFASCPLCLQSFASVDLFVVLPCHPSHLFHRDCLRDWFKEYLSCPMCRRDFTTQP